MRAGKQLDILVAKKIMGRRNLGANFLTSINDQREAIRDFWWNTPPYSTSISAALDVIEKVTSENWIGFTIDFRPKRADNGHAWEREAKFIVKTSYGGQGVTPGVEIISSSLPEAICLAALEVTQEK